MSLTACLPLVPLNGVRVYVNPYMPQHKLLQYKFPRSKRVRIRKKWRKQARNYRKEPVIWFIEGALYVHPTNYDAVRRSVTQSVTSK